MRRALVMMTVVLTALAVAGGASADVGGVRPDRPRPAGAVIDAVVERRLTTAGASDLLDVVVVMRARADLSSVVTKKRQKRLATVEHELRTIAATAQEGVLSFLARQEQRGLATAIEPLWIVNGIDVKATPDVIRQLAARPDVQEIQPNISIHAPWATATTSSAPAEPNVGVVNAPAMWALGYRGQGIVVANMDTGVDVSHPELASRWRGGTNSWYDPNGQHPSTPTDVNGHGTWTMGAMVGGDAGGTAIGVAPDAEWIAVKIFNDHGTATSTGIHLGFQWLLDPDGNAATADAPNVVNNSWTSSFGCNLDFEPDLQSLRAAGILPVFAAGNDGPTPGTSESPANNPEAFAVGSTNNADVVDPSSSRGPSACAQPAYPQLVAPGVGVRTTDLYGGYASETGTSMAAPHVAGALALLLEAFPGMSADRQAAALEGGAVDLGPAGADNTYGYGRLDVLAAYDWLRSTPDFTVDASPSSVSTSPGGTVSYDIAVGDVNGFAGDVSLSLTGLSGSQAAWGFSPVVVTGGSGASQLTVPTTSNIAPGIYPLTVTGTSGALSHTAAVSLVITSPPDFSITATPASRSIAAGAATSFTVAVSSSNGFGDDVDLSLTGLNASIGGASFSPSAVTGGSGTASLAITTLPTAAPGTYPLTITGTSGPLSHPASVSLIVTAPPDFSLGVTPGSRSVAAGSPTTFSVTVGAIAGFDDDVGLSLSGLPASVGSASFSPPVVTGGAGTSTLAITTIRTAAPGTYPLTITGTSGGLSHSASVSLVVTAPPDFSISVTPSSVTVTRGHAATYTVKIASLRGFSGTVSLSVTGLGSGASASFKPASVIAPGSSTLTVKTTSKAARGTFTLTIRGSKGGVVHTMTAKLVIK